MDLEADPQKTLTGAIFKLQKGPDSENAYADVTGYESIEVDADGKADISGLGDGEYRLLETKTPAGYIPLSSPIKFKVTNGSVEFTNTDYVTYSDENQTFTVGNKAGLALPTTGGSGTLAYTAGGLALILLAAVLLMIRKRKIMH